MERTVQIVLAGLLAGIALTLAPGGTRATAGPRPAIDRAHAPTIVSLEFDHALADALPGVQLANSLGMKVTLFAMSGRIGLPTYMTVGQLQQLQAQGDEIGGHTIDHKDLSHLSRAAQRHEICDDRAALEADGLDVTDFAYPYGHFNAATPEIVRSCGYQSARGAGGLASQGGCYGLCPAVESIPPADPWVTRTVNSVLDTTRLATIEGYVTRAERDGGGWLQIVFHYVCDACDPYSVTMQNLSSFLSWLRGQAPSGVSEETVREVINTPFVAAPIRVSAGRGRAVRLFPAERCPRLPIGARCVAAPETTIRKLRLGGDPWLIVTTHSKATRISLSITRRGRDRRIAGPSRAAVALGAAKLRWKIALPRPVAGGVGTLTIEYPLGRATYPLRLAMPRGAPR